MANAVVLVVVYRQLRLTARPAKELLAVTHQLRCYRPTARAATRTKTGRSLKAIEIEAGLIKQTFRLSIAAMPLVSARVAVALVLVMGAVVVVADPSISLIARLISEIVACQIVDQRQTEAMRAPQLVGPRPPTVIASPLRLRRLPPRRDKKPRTIGRRTLERPPRGRPISLKT